MKSAKESVRSLLQSLLIQSWVQESLKHPRILQTCLPSLISLIAKKSRQPSSNVCITAGSISPATRISNFNWWTCSTTASWFGMKDLLREVWVIQVVRYSKSEEESDLAWGQWGDAVGVAVCMNIGVCTLLSSVSGISVNCKAATRQCDSADAVPDCLTDVWHDAGVLEAETLGCRHIDACITGAGVFLCEFG